MRNADYKNLNLSQRSINRRLDHMAEDMEILSELFRLFIADPVGIRQELMDAVQPSITGPVDADTQGRWLEKIQKDKLRKLIARTQQKQRSLAAKKVTPQDTEQAFIFANHLI
jgi:hypothetical protein